MKIARLLIAACLVGLSSIITIEPPLGRAFTLSSETLSQPGQIIHVPGDYPTIAQALTATHSGDTLQVAAGTYREGSLAIPSGVSLVGAGWQSTIIDGNGANVAISLSPNTLVEGFTN